MRMKWAFLDFLQAREIVPRNISSSSAKVKQERGSTTKREPGQNPRASTNSGAGPSTSTLTPRKRGPTEVIEISSDDDDDEDDEDIKGLKPEERVEFARLKVNRH